jgi:hypothetical protein
MKIGRFVLVILSMLLVTVAFNIGAVCADTDATLSDSVVSDPAGTAINSEDLVPVVQGALLDNFNRANGPIGSNWTNRAGTFQVVNNAAQGGLRALATYNGVTSTVIEGDVAVNGTALQYTGLVLGYAALNNNLFMKVQESAAGGQFSHAAFYVGNNSSGGSFGPGYFALDSPFSTAHMKVELVGSTVTMTFSNIDGGGGTQTYVGTGAPATGGSGIGICGYNTLARMDNFATPGAVCDYCFTDTYGFNWCLDVVNTDGMAYYLMGTVQAGVPTYDAMATYVYNGKRLTMTAYHGPAGYAEAFTYNTRFISATTARGVWINSAGLSGHIDASMVPCGAGASMEAESAGPSPTDTE